MKIISAENVKQLRENTGAGYMDCKKALEEAKGDMQGAISLLRQKGISVAKKKIHRTTKEGIIGSYIHFDNQIGVMIEANCETDFAAVTDNFKTFINDIATHIAAMNPRYISCEDIPPTIIESEKDIYRKQAQDEGKPEKIIDNIVNGKLKKFYTTNCLLEQEYYRDSDLIIRDVLNNCIARLGENITIKRFVRYEIGER